MGGLNGNSSTSWIRRRDFDGQMMSLETIAVVKTYFLRKKIVKKKKKQASKKKERKRDSRKQTHILVNKQRFLWEVVVFSCTVGDTLWLGPQRSGRTWSCHQSLREPVSSSLPKNSIAIWSTYPAENEHGP